MKEVVVDLGQLGVHDGKVSFEPRAFFALRSFIEAGCEFEFFGEVVQEKIFVSPKAKGSDLCTLGKLTISQFKELVCEKRCPIGRRGECTGAEYEGNGFAVHGHPRALVTRRPGETDRELAIRVARVPCWSMGWLIVRK